MTWLQRLKTKSSTCPECGYRQFDDVKTGSPIKHCGCGIIGPKKIGAAPYPKSPAKKSNEPRKTTKGKGRNFRTVEEGAGMTKKGVAEYRRKNPGSKLKTAVTGKVKKGSKAAKRRKSFCARSKNWKGPRGRAARRRWRC